MKKTAKITLCAMMAALSAVVMLVSYFPYLTYAIPAFAGLFVMVVVIEINRKWAVLTYIASAIIVFLLAETESKLMYIMFLGYYPILKSALEVMHKPVFEWIIKIIVFNAAVVAVYVVFSQMFGITLDDIDILGRYGAVILLAVGNAVFVVYDIAVSRMAMVYMYVLHPKIKKLLL